MLIFRLAVLLTLASAWPSVHAQTLNILTWEAYLAEAVVARWESRTGARIRQIYYDNDEDRNSLLSSYDQETLDLVIIDQISAPVFGEQGILLAVREYSGTDNLQHIDPPWTERCGDYSVPYLWGTVGLVYRKDKVTPAPDSWNALIHPDEKLHQHIGLVENYIDTLAPSLLLRGASVNTPDETLLAEVFDELKGLLPSILTFDYPISYLNSSPRADELYLALAYSGDQYELNNISQSNNWEYVIPKEGFVQWVDCFAILSNSQNQALAMDFLNFINEPAVAALNSEQLAVASPSSTVQALQSEQFRNNPMIYPTPEIMSRSQHYGYSISLTNVRVRNRITNALVNIHESQ